MNDTTEFEYRKRGNQVFESKYFLLPDKILDQKTHRLRLIMRAAATLVTGPTYYARVWSHAALSWTLANYVVEYTYGNFFAFALFSALATPAFFLNKWHADDIATQQKKSFILKPDLVYSNDARIINANDKDLEHDLPFCVLKSCFASSRENAWFTSLVIEETHASPIVKSWRAFCAGIKFGLRHNVLRSFMASSLPGEQIVFRLDNAGYRKPTSKLDFYGHMAIEESHVLEENAWTLPTHRSRTSPNVRQRQHQRQRHTSVMKMLYSIPKTAATSFPPSIPNKLATLRHKSASATHKPARQI